MWQRVALTWPLAPALEYYNRRTLSGTIVQTGHSLEARCRGLHGTLPGGASAALTGWAVETSQRCEAHRAHIPSSGTLPYTQNTGLSSGRPWVDFLPAEGLGFDERAAMLQVVWVLYLVFL